MVQTSGPGWWYLPMRVCWWTALKLVGNSPHDTVRLPILRAQENLAMRRAIRKAAAQPGGSRQEWTPERRRQLVDKVRARVLAEDHGVA